MPFQASGQSDTEFLHIAATTMQYHSTEPDGRAPGRRQFDQNPELCGNRQSGMYIESAAHQFPHTQLGV